MECITINGWQRNYVNMEINMGRFFNTAGPVSAEKHYCIPPLDRIDLKTILSLIGQKKYFVLHAPRQTGKTSYLLALMEYLNKEGTYTALYTNIENALAARENVKEGMRTILQGLSRDMLDYLEDPFLKERWQNILAESGAFSAFHQSLTEWSKHNPKPVVLLLDEVDSLVGDTLISLLRQLRSGYTKRPARFPQSVILCGVRNVRDYRFHSDVGKSVITGGSGFNIIAESLRMGKFSAAETRELFEQHARETGQRFHEDVFPLVRDLTEGQPWLVNALAYETCFKMEEGQNRETEITAAMINRAKENLILRRETHLHQLTDKLKEKRVRRVIEPILAGFSEAAKIPSDDVDYAEDLGLIKKKPQLAIANRVYREAIPRELTYSTQLTIHQEAAWYIDDKGRLDMDKLITAFQGFFRKHFEHWVDGFDYAEAGPQLLLQAFLQRIVNSGGQVGREYGLGRQRTDLLVTWPFKEGTQEAVLELKIRYGSLETTIQKGLEQTWKYMDKCGTKEGYLLIFDRRENIAWEQKIFRKEEQFNNIPINVYGM
jgi:hypothetical protein